MKIRKARKSDWEGYYNLKVEESKEYRKSIGKDIKMPSGRELKKEFEEFISNRSLIIFVIEIKNNLVAYTNCKIHRSFWANRGYVDDIFVLKSYRRKGLATKLMDEFVKFLKSRKINEIELSVNPKNKKAIKLYKKEDFELVKYELRKKLK